MASTRSRLYVHLRQLVLDTHKAKEREESDEHPGWYAVVDRGGVADVGTIPSSGTCICDGEGESEEEAQSSGCFELHLMKFFPHSAT